MELRSYQQQAIDAVRASLRAQSGTRSTILVSPTGSGKTAMAAFMTRRAMEQGRVYFVCHRRELIEQTSTTFDAVGIRHNITSSGYPFIPRTPVQICSVGTLVNRMDKIAPPGLVIWDECHHIGAATWAKIREQWTQAIHVGLTATPQRLDGKGLGEWFQDLVLGPTVAELMESGNLSQYEIYAPITVSNFHKRAGEFIRAEMEASLGAGEIIGGVVDHWKKHAEGRKTIGFAISIHHSEALVERFKEAGVRAAHLDAKSATFARKAVLQSFARGAIEVLFNVDLFGEGFDLAANSGMDVNVEAVILARPTASLGLHLQQIGRGLRPKPEPCIVLDHAGNVVRHGFPDDDREWSLAGEDKKQAAPGTKVCKACFAVLRPHVQTCPYCGHAFVRETVGRSVVEVDGKLARLEKQVSDDEKLRALVRLERARNLPIGWAVETFNAWRARRTLPQSRRL